MASAYASSIQIFEALRLFEEIDTSSCNSEHPMPHTVSNVHQATLVYKLIQSKNVQDILILIISWLEREDKILEVQSSSLIVMLLDMSLRSKSRADPKTFALSLDEGSFANEEDEATAATIDTFISTCFGLITAHTEGNDVDDENITRRGEVHFGMVLIRSFLLYGPHSDSFSMRMKRYVTKVVYERCLDQGIRLIQASMVPSQSHEILAHVVSPILQLQLSEEAEDALLDLEDFLRKTAELDLLSQSAILCLILGGTSARKQRFVQLIRSARFGPSYWLLLQRLLLSQESLCRKRASSALKLTLDLLEPYFGHNADTLGSLAFFDKFLLVFTQLEGVNSTHLFEQVDDIVTSLFSTVASLRPAEKATGHARCSGEGAEVCSVLLYCVPDESNLPQPSFCWLKALLHLLLGLSHPTIRKETLGKLFGGKWRVNPTDRDVQDWVSSELLHLISSPMYFPSTLASRVAPDSRGAKSHPGSQLPTFLLQHLGAMESPECHKRFLQMFVSTLFGEDAPRGALVSTWCTICFEEEVGATRVPEETFDDRHLQMVGKYVNTHLSSTNNALRENLYRGLVPLLVQGACVHVSGPERLISVLREIGLHKATSSPSLLKLLMHRLSKAPLSYISERTPYSSILVHAATGERDRSLLEKVSVSSDEHLSIVSAILDLAALEKTASRTLVPVHLIEHVKHSAADYAKSLLRDADSMDRKHNMNTILHMTRVAAQLLSLDDREECKTVTISFLRRLVDKVKARGLFFDQVLGVRLSNAFLCHIGSAAAHMEDLIMALLDIDEPNTSQHKEAIIQAREDQFLEEVIFNDTGYGKFASLFSQNKWMSITATFKLLAASSTGVNFLSLAKVRKYLHGIHEKLEVLSVESTSFMLSSLSHMMRVVLPKAEENCDCVGLYHDILERAWILIVEGAECIYWPSLLAFVDLLLFPEVTIFMDTAVLKELFAKAVNLGLKQRPALLHILAYRLGALLLRDPTRLLGSLQEEIVLLLIFLREPQVDDRHATNAIAPTTTDESDLCHKAARFIILSSLERIIEKDDENSKPALHGLVRSLIDMNGRADFRHQALIGSDAFVFKLRCWQTLCVLAPVVDEGLISEIIETYFRTLTVSCCAATRTHIEMFGALLVKSFPTLMLPRVLAALQDFNLSQSTLCSLLILLGFVLYPEETNTASKEEAQVIINAVLPWMGTSSGLSRAITLLLLLCLIPRVVSDLHHKGIDDPQAHLKDLYRLLRENKEAKKVVKRQQHFFRDYCLHDKNTLKGLLSMPMESGGEIMPSNLTAVILEVFRANIIDSRNKDQELGSREEGLHTHVQENKFENTLLQTKIVPFDELKLALSTESHARSRNGALRSKQSLVVCASLVDKVQNLAGIARTCEIFAVEQLVIPDVNLTKLESFQGIAVTADQWLDIAEVKETALLPWLRQKRAEGYRIAGLEQTSSSHVLGDTPLPEKCILLLGKEKEGIPVELLKEVTLSIEIPQFGVIRSLNVHVSAAIAIWELTKSNVAAGQLHM